MPLTQFEIQNAKPAEKPYKLFDGGGLHLVVQPNGSRLWRLKYYFLGKERLLAIGAYPLFSLAEARARRDEAKKLLASGVDPNVKKKLDKLAAEASAQNTFGLIAAEFVHRHEEKGSAHRTKEKIRWLLTEVAAPLSNRPIAEITSAEVLDLLKRVEHSGRRETAKRLRATISAVFRLAIATLRASNDPTTALALLWQLMFEGFIDEFLTIRTSLWRRPCEEIEYGLPDGRNARLRRRSPDSFFSAPQL